MNPLIASGLELMMIGMGTVFVFLMFLVLGTGIMSSLINKYAGEGTPYATADTTHVIDDELRQVIVEAVRLHRRRGGID